MRRRIRSFVELSTARSMSRWLMRIATTGTATALTERVLHSPAVML
jgi:hypothetical protein